MSSGLGHINLLPRRLGLVVIIITMINSLVAGISSTLPSRLLIDTLALSVCRRCWALSSVVRAVCELSMSSPSFKLSCRPSIDVSAFSALAARSTPRRQPQNADDRTYSAARHGTIGRSAGAARRKAARRAGGHVTVLSLRAPSSVTTPKARRRHATSAGMSPTTTVSAQISATCHVLPTCRDMSATLPI